MANRRYRPDLGYNNIASCVGDATAADFKAWLRVYDTLPNVDEILAGNGADIPWPGDTDVIWALATNLSSRLLGLHDYKSFEHGVLWLLTKASAEWKTRFTVELRELSEQNTGVNPNFRPFYYRAFTETEVGRREITELSLRTARLTAAVDSAGSSGGSGKKKK
jgi:hypothetical protein